MQMQKRRSDIPVTPPFSLLHGAGGNRTRVRKSIPQSIYVRVVRFLVSHPISRLGTPASHGPALLDLIPADKAADRDQPDLATSSERPRAGSDRRRARKVSYAANAS